MWHFFSFVPPIPPRLTFWDPPRGWKNRPPLEIFWDPPQTLGPLGMYGWLGIHTYIRSAEVDALLLLRWGGKMSLDHYRILPPLLSPNIHARGRRVSTDVQQEKVVNKEIPLKCTAAFSWRQKTPVLIHVRTSQEELHCLFFLPAE